MKKPTPVTTYVVKCQVFQCPNEATHFLVEDTDEGPKEWWFCQACATLILSQSKTSGTH